MVVAAAEAAVDQVAILGAAVAAARPVGEPAEAGKIYEFTQKNKKNRLRPN